MNTKTTGTEAVEGSNGRSCKEADNDNTNEITNTTADNTHHDNTVTCTHTHS